MRVLVLGGTQFLGPFVVNELLRRGHEVAAVSRRACALFDAEIRAFVGEASSPAVLAEAVSAWQPEGLVDLLHRNAAHAQAVAQVCGGVQHSLHVSCISVYGPTPICPVEESTDPVRPEFAGPEVLDQIAADQVVLELAAQRKLPGTVVRLAQLYGPRDPRCAEWFFARRVRDGRAQVALPDMGLAIRHRGFVQNMAWGIAQALGLPRAVGEVYNLGDEKVYTLLQLARGVARALGHKWEIYSVPGHLWPTPYGGTCFLDLRKARAQLRYKDRMFPRDGLELTLAGLHQQPFAGEWSWPGLDAPFDYAREDQIIAQHGLRLEPERLDEAQRHKEI